MAKFARLGISMILMPVWSSTRMTVNAHILRREAAGLSRGAKQRWPKSGTRDQPGSHEIWLGFAKFEISMILMVKHLSDC